MCLFVWSFLSKPVLLLLSLTISLKATVDCHRVHNRVHSLMDLRLVVGNHLAKTVHVFVYMSVCPICVVCRYTYVFVCPYVRLLMCYIGFCVFSVVCLNVFVVVPPIYMWVLVSCRFRKRRGLWSTASR